jgi:hypothetical protein
LQNAQSELLGATLQFLLGCAHGNARQRDPALSVRYEFFKRESVEEGLLTTSWPVWWPAN